MLVHDQRARWHGKYIKEKVFQPGDWALLHDSKLKHFKGKFSTRWLGPYEVDEVFDNGLVKIKTIDDHHISFVVNGHRLKIYQKPISKEEFIKIFQNNSEMKLVKKNPSSPPT